LRKSPLTNQQRHNRTLHDLGGNPPAKLSQVGFQDIHAKFLLIIIDEADGVPMSHFDAIDVLATNINAHFLPWQPRQPVVALRLVRKPGSGSRFIPIDGLLTPNLRRSSRAIAALAS
jgi:hypothetical protein